MISLKMSGEQGVNQGKEEKASLPAPLWHFVSFILMFLSVEYGAKYIFAFAHPGRSATRLFVTLIAFNLVMALYAIWGFHLNGNSDRVFYSEDNSSSRPAGEDLAIGGVLFICCLIVSVVFGLMFPGGGRNYMPKLAKTDLDKLLGFVVSVVAPICEEVQFRGYILRQLDAITQNTGMAIVVQAVFFVMMHGSGQGVSGYLTRFIYGIAFGLIATWRKNLWPSITAHLLVDLTALTLAGI
jgi:membrane protease YdiL (CAAX protease family)